MLTSSVTGSPAPPAPAPRRWRRQRAWLVLLAISVGWKIIVLTLGAAVPRWMIDDGITLLPVAEQAYALQAKTMAMELWDHPVERFGGVVRALRVIRVDSTVSFVLESPPSANRPAGAEPCQGVEATVRAYTYFAIPYSEARVGCGTGVVQYRVFRRWR